MRRLHIVMPMAGRGSRFANAGFTTPKPLIPVDGRPMFLKALSSFDAIEAPKAYTIIIRKQHDEQYDLQKQLKEKLPDANIVMTDVGADLS
jgi:2-C-methyl-D-erythritol 4-phosphate cytidylyltransferase